MRRWFGAGKEAFDIIVLRRKRKKAGGRRKEKSLADILRRSGKFLSNTRN